MSLAKHRQASPRKEAKKTLALLGELGERKIARKAPPSLAKKRSKKNLGAAWRAWREKDCSQSTAKPRQEKKQKKPLRCLASLARERLLAKQR